MVASKVDYPHSDAVWPDGRTTVGTAKNYRRADRKDQPLDAIRFFRFDDMLKTSSAKN